MKLGEDRTGSPPALRVALLVDAWLVPAWVHKIVVEIQSAPWAEIVLVVLNTSRRDEGLWHKLWRRRRYLLYEGYCRLDRRLFKTRPDAFAREDLSPVLGDCPVLPVVPRQTRYSDFFPAQDLAAMAAYDLDVALRFGFRILRGEVLELPRHGVWSYHHDDNNVIRGGPPGFWEVMEDHPVTGSMLQVLGEGLDAGRVLYRSYAPTHRRSVQRNKQHVYWKSAAFVGRRLRDLQADLQARGSQALTPPGEDAYRPYSRRLYRKPTNLELLPHLTRFALRAGSGWLRDRTSRNQWLLAYRLGSKADEGPDELFRFRTLVPPRDRFWADPFPLVVGDRRFVFHEEYVYRRARGHINVLELGSDGRPSPSRTVLERPYHLSYPFVFQWRGETFMIPESAENGTVELYRATRLPDEWTLEETLLEGTRGVDATLFDDGERWWMFLNVAAPEAAHCHDELYLFGAETPLGPWRPHRKNPAKSDARGSRPAGGLFRWRGRLYRPAQDCSRRYGHSIAIHEVRRLDSGGYEEVKVATVRPLWYPGLLATHTLNRTPGLTVVDGMRRQSRLVPGGSRRRARDIG